MTNTSEHPDTEHHAKLRLTAEDLIAKGTAPKRKGATLGIDALELLYRRASDPESAPDALKLLHELQTHQVELDMMYEQLQANEYEINGELNHYKALFEHAPIAYLIVANDGQITDSNEAAVTLFGLPAVQLTEQAVSQLLSPQSGAPLAEMFQALLAPGSQASCVADLPANDKTGPTRRLTINATCDARGDSMFVVLCPTPDSVTPDPMVISPEPDPAPPGP